MTQHDLPDAEADYFKNALIVYDRYRTHAQAYFDEHAAIMRLAFGIPDHVETVWRSNDQ